GDSLTYSTFLGCTGTDAAYGLTLSGSGDIVVTGLTDATFPTTSGCYDPSPNGGQDVFVARLSGSNGALMYSTLLGGASTDQGEGIAVDGSGHALGVGNS